MLTDGRQANSRSKREQEAEATFGPSVEVSTACVLITEAGSESEFEINFFCLFESGIKEKQR